MKKLFLALIASSVIVLMGITSCSKGSDSKTKVIIKGSTTVLPITQKAVEAYAKTRSHISISISAGGSGEGIKALLDGSTDIANSSREMKDEERILAKQKGITVKEITVAHDMIVPVVHPSNPIKNLTLTQLKGIYDGSITNWKQIGGTDTKIVVVSRDTSSGTYEIWEKIVMKQTNIKKEALLQASNGAIASVISQNTKAIGYIGYGYINPGIKPLSVNGIEGTLENGKKGTYPISRKLYMYINEKTASQETLDFINFLLSPDGQKLVTEAGFISL